MRIFVNDNTINKSRPVFQEVEQDTSCQWQELQHNHDLLGNFHEQLRGQLTTELPVTEPQNIVSQHAVAAVEEALKPELSNKAALNTQLITLFEQQQKIYLAADIPKSLRKKQYINASGLVMPPDHCITTIKDTLRVSAFWRGIEQAIADLWQRFDGPLHIVYPACGPFAPLLLPLLTYYREKKLFTPKDITVTFIDIQEGATLALTSLIKALHLEDYVEQVLCQDAMDYQSKQPVHLVVLEAMQHGFSREGHFSLARHFSTLLVDGGVLLPQSVSVRARLNVAQREYVEQWHTANSPMSAASFNRPDTNGQQRKKFIDDRTELGEILHLDLHFLRSLKIKVLNQATSMAECNTVLIPHCKNNHDKQTLMIYTSVNTYGDNWLNEYESGITQPLPDMSVCINFTPQEVRAGDLLVNSGDHLTFYYCLNGLPGFLATVAPKLPSDNGEANTMQRGKTQQHSCLNTSVVEVSDD
jgi:hypothetical protein